MTITLGILTLNQHVSWRGRFANAFPGQERITLGGKVIVDRLLTGNQAGSDIMLEAIEEDNIRKGYFTQAQLEQIEIYKNSGETIILGYHGVNIPVVVKHDGVYVEKTLWQSTYTADERYVGSIGLKRVG